MPPAVVHLCVQRLKALRTFILMLEGGTSRQRAGEMPLGKCFEVFLSETEPLPLCSLWTEACLHHLNGVLKLLKQVEDREPLDRVDPKYRVALPEDLRDALTLFQRSLSSEGFEATALAQVLADFAEARLTDTWLGDDVAMLDVLMEVEELSDHRRGFLQAHFPGGLCVSHWVAVCQALQAPQARTASRGLGHSPGRTGDSPGGSGGSVLEREG